MDDRSTRLLSSHPEAYSRAFQCFLDSCDQENSILKCITEHITPLIVNNRIQDLFNSSPFRVLSVGSGEGENDINILEALSKILPNKEKDKPISFVNRVVEPAVDRLSAFHARAENLPESLKNVRFEWIPATFQEYVQQKRDKKEDTQMSLVHFIHSIYYVDIEEALIHCYENELGSKGIIITVCQAEDDVMFKYSKEFPKIRTASYPEKCVAAVAREKGWLYYECPGDYNRLDIKSVFDGLSPEGNDLLDFLTDMVDVRKLEDEDTVNNILNFWMEQSFSDEDGKRIVKLKDRAVIILKGF